MKKSRIGKLIFLSIVIALNLAALEVAARVYKAVTRGPAPVVPPQIGRFDPDLGWALIPDSVASSARTGYTIEYRTNSAGLRDDETTLGKPEGVYRVVLLGDSRTFGFGVPIEKHFSMLLEGYIPDLEVINLGVSGYGVDQELLALRQKGLGYEPDLVISYVAHYGDHRHMHGDRFGKQKPRFRVTSQGLVLEDLIAPERNDPERWGLASCHQGLRANSTLYRILSRRLARLAGAEVEDVQATYRRQSAQDEADRNDPAFVKRMNDLGIAIVSEIDAESRRAGAEFLLVTQVDALHRAAQARNLRSLDVSPALDNPAFSLPEELAHVNESGNGVLAWEIAQFLRANGLVPSARK